MGVVRLNIVGRISVLASIVQEIQPNYRHLLPKKKKKKKGSRHKMICDEYETQILPTSTIFILNASRMVNI
jgi:uncharacterized protein (DUF4213/DUF364 family)